MDWSLIWETVRHNGLHWVALAVVFTVMVFGAAHAIMYKRDSRAAVAWVGLIWLSPLIGVVLYSLLGINRIHRRAIRHRARSGPRRDTTTTERAAVALSAATPDGLPAGAQHLAPLRRLVEKLTDRELLHGNRIEPLGDGDEAYPPMLAAIDSAQKSVALCTYIFDHDRVGKKFVDALGKAVRRGVAVRVIIDDVGARYHWPNVRYALRDAKVPFQRFLPTFFPGRFTYSNLRTHRKLLIADGRLGFTGGLNIREGHCLSLRPSYPIEDLHFRLEGPIVGQMQDVFTSDWAFCCGEVLEGEAWFPELRAAGHAPARGIAAGPDEDVDKRRLALLGAITCARESILIVTPYFLPDHSLIMALDIAAMRGVEVDIILPEKNNLLTVAWACEALLWQVLERGCRVWMSPPPFDHTKLMVVDGAWMLFGSGNWDPRSLRLNFELDVECYDEQLAASMRALAVRKRDGARRVTLEEVDSRGIPRRLRDGIARLVTPYL